MGRRWDWGFGLDEVGTSSALLVSCSSGFSFYIVSRNPSTPSVTGAYPFLYCAAISVFLTPVPSHRCMPVRMIFGSTNACSFELLKRCKAILHNSKCRYGERGAADAKPKAQIILDAAKVSAASGGSSEPKQGQRSQSARGFCPRSTMRVPQPDIIEHFGNADAVPQPPERCLSRKAGIVRCCPNFFVYDSLCFLTE